MSPMGNYRFNKDSKFTRGEKCIFIHLVLTFIVILVLVLVYFGHLCAVAHLGADVFRVARRSAGGRCATLAPTIAPQPHSNWVYNSSHCKGGDTRANCESYNANTCTASVAVGERRVGVVRAGARRACGALLVRRRWSLAPAHCVAARAHPALSRLLPTWHVKYLLHTDNYVDSAIIQGIVHSRFNRDDFDNNIGLFQLLNPIIMDDILLGVIPISTEFLRQHTDMSLVGWAADSTTDMLKELAIKPLPQERCKQYLSPVVELRSYEFCVHTDKINVSIEHGAVVVFNAQIKGLFTWGDKKGHLPLIIIDIGFYKDWIESTVIQSP